MVVTTKSSQRQAAEKQKLEKQVLVNMSDEARQKLRTVSQMVKKKPQRRPKNQQQHPKNGGKTADKKHRSLVVPAALFDDNNLLSLPNQIPKKIPRTPETDSISPLSHESSSKRGGDGATSTLSLLVPMGTFKKKRAAEVPVARRGDRRAPSSSKHQHKKLNVRKEKEQRKLGKSDTVTTDDKPRPKKKRRITLPGMPKSSRYYRRPEEEEEEAEEDFEFTDSSDVVQGVRSKYFVTAAAGSSKNLGLAKRAASSFDNKAKTHHKSAARLLLNDTKSPGLSATSDNEASAKVVEVQSKKRRVTMTGVTQAEATATVNDSDVNLSIRRASFSESSSSDDDDEAVIKPVRASSIEDRCKQAANAAERKRKIKANNKNNNKPKNPIKSDSSKKTPNTNNHDIPNEKGIVNPRMSLAVDMDEETDDRAVAYTPGVVSSTRDSTTMVSMGTSRKTVRSASSAMPPSVSLSPVVIKKVFIFAGGRRSRRHPIKLDRGLVLP